MIFIAKYGKYGLQVRPEVKEQYATGGERVIQTPLYANFTPGDVYPLSPPEREEALNRFYLLGGMPQNVDEATHVEPDYRIGRFDTRQAQLDNQWSDEERELVEEKLLEASAIYPDALFRMPAIVSAAPWPAYDSFKGSPAQLAKKAYEDGHSLEDVIAYEMANQNRDAVIAALGAILAEQGEQITEGDLEVVG